MFCRCLVGIFLLLPYVALGAINPKPWLRVHMFWFIEEPASAFFSLLLLIVSIYGLITIRIASVTKKKDERAFPVPFSGLYQATMVMWVWTYVWSTLFHIYETPLNESMDYISAVLATGFIGWVTILRAFNIQNISIRTLIFLPFLFRCGYFVYYMKFVKFDYGYAVMTAGSHIGMESAVYCLLAAYSIYISLFSKKGYRFNSDGKQLYFLWGVGARALLLCALPLELFDFRPIWGVFDGHSLWHAAGSLILLGTIKFAEADVQWLKKRQRVIREKRFEI